MKNLLQGNKSRSVLILVGIILIIGVVIAYFSMGDDEVSEQKTIARAQGKAKAKGFKSIESIPGGGIDAKSTIRALQTKTQKEKQDKSWQGISSSTSAQLMEHQIIPLNEVTKLLGSSNLGGSMSNKDNKTGVNDFNVNDIGIGDFVKIKGQCFKRVGNKLNKSACPTKCGAVLWVPNENLAITGQNMCHYDSEPKFKRQVIDIFKTPQFVPKQVTMKDFIQGIDGKLFEFNAQGCLVQKSCSNKPEPGSIIIDGKQKFLLGESNKRIPYKNKLKIGQTVWQGNQPMTVGEQGKLEPQKVFGQQCDAPKNSVVWADSKRYVSIGKANLVPVNIAANAGDLSAKRGGMNKPAYYQIVNLNEVQFKKSLEPKPGQVIWAEWERQLVGPAYLRHAIPRLAIIGNYINDRKGTYLLQSGINTQEKLSKATPVAGDMTWKNCRPYLYTTDSSIVPLTTVYDSSGNVSFKTAKGITVYPSATGGITLVNKAGEALSRRSDGKLWTDKAWMAQLKEKARKEKELARKRALDAEKNKVMKNKKESVQKAKQDLDKKRAAQQQVRQQKDLLMKRKKEMEKYKRLLQAKANQLMSSWGKGKYSMQMVNVSSFSASTGNSSGGSSSKAAPLTFSGGSGGGILEPGKMPGADIPGSAKVPTGGGAKATVISGGNGQGCKPSSTVLCFRPGDILYAKLKTAINSDIPTPLVFATITQGPLSGSDVIGKVSLTRGPSSGGSDANNNIEGLTLTFDRINLLNQHTSIALPGAPIAVDPATTEQALATSVNRHYLLRYGSLFGTAFLTGMNQAVMASLSFNSNTSGGGTSVNFGNQAAISTKTAIAAGVGKIGEQIAQKMDLFDTPPTIKLDAGTEFGLLFLQDTKIKLPDTMMDYREQLFN